MNAGLILSLLLAASAGLLLVRAWGPRPASRFISLGWQISAAIGIGLGLSSCTFFLWALLLTPSTPGLIAAEAALVGLLAGGRALWGRGRSSRGQPPAPVAAGPAWLPRVLAAAFGLALIAALVQFVFLSRAQPHGEWDAWAIWNTRARFLFRGGGYWRDGFSPLLVTHPDYPPLVPAAVARLWVSAGSDTFLAPALVAGFFTLATVGVVTATLGMVRSRSQGYLAGLVLLGTGVFIQHGASQYADVPLGFFMVTTLALLILAEHAPDSMTGSLLLAGVAAGCAAWTKNEGLLFVLAVVLGRAVTLIPRQGFRVFVKRLIPFALGLLPLLALVGYFKLRIAPPSELFAHLASSALVAKLCDGSRYAVIAAGFLRSAALFRQWAVLAPYALLVGLGRRAALQPALAPTAAVLGLMASGYFTVYLLSPHDLQWHVAMSLPRLLVQLWPVAVMTVFLALRTPEEAAVRAAGSPRG